MTNPSTSPSSWRLQLSLRTLLVTIFVLGVCFGWMADHLHQGRALERQFRSLQALHNERVARLEEDLQAIKQGNSGNRVSPELAALVRKGAIISTAPDSVTIAWADAGDDDLAALGHARTISHLSLADGHFTPSGLDQLRELSRLESLSLQGAWCDGPCLAKLAALKQLRTLRIGGAQLDDVSIAPVGKLSNLRMLSVYNTPISNFALFHIGSLEQLEFLSLDNTGVGDEGLVHLKPLRNLRTLSIRNSRISDAGRVHLQLLEGLSDLRLTETGITDAGLLQLASMKTLREVSVVGTDVTAAGVAEFRKKSPKCNVTIGKGRRT